MQCVSDSDCPANPTTHIVGHCYAHSCVYADNCNQQNPCESGYCCGYDIYGNPDKCYSVGTIKTGSDNNSYLCTS